jgi:hypothetical protein
MRLRPAHYVFMDNLHSQRLAAAGLFGAALLTDPLMSLFNDGILVLGMPLVYAYVFSAWLALIVLLAALVAGNSRRERGRE